MVASTVARFATLLAVVMVVCYASAEPEPTPEPVNYPWAHGPPTCHKPVCCASTTTVGALVVPTLATVHSRGKARSHDGHSHKHCASCY